MRNETKKIEETDILRRQAEKLLKDKQKDGSIPLSESDTIKLLYELEVHQIELEMQNEELNKAKAKAELIAEKYTNLYDFAPAGYLTLDKSGRIFELNLNAASILGRVRLNLIKSNFNLLITPESRSTFNHFFEKIFQTHINQVCEVQLYIKEKPSLYIHLEGIVSDDKEYCLLTAIDISDRIEAETMLLKAKEKAEKNEKELNKAQHIAHLGSWYLDLATNKVIWTEELYKIYGLEPSLPIPPSSEYLKLFTPKSRKVLLKAMKRTSETGIPYELELKILRKDGSLGWLWLSGETVSNQEGKIIGLWGAAQDITERKLAEEKIRESNELNQSLLRTIPFGINIVDLEGNVLFINNNLKNIYGEKAIGQKCWQIYRDDQNQCNDCPLKLGIIVGETSTFETGGVAGGKFFEISHTGMMFQGEKAVLEIFKDISKRKQQEIELIKAKDHAEESDRLKSAFLANMSHEIRTPMNGILGFADLLKEPDLTGEEQQNYIQIIEKSGARMLSIINDIVSISKIEAGLMDVNCQKTNLNKLIEDIYTFFKPEVGKIGRHISYHNALIEGEAFLYTDREKLFAVFTNLVKNSIKYAQKGSIEFGYLKKDNYFEFYVKDTGIGIPKDRQKAIFERFIQSDNTSKNAIGGTGLGLSISKAYIEMQGGTIWLESEQGKGSTFYFNLPIQKGTNIENS